MENLEAYSPICLFVCLSVLLSCFICVLLGHFQNKMASGVFNISVFVRIEYGAWPLSDQNGFWSYQPGVNMNSGVSMNNGVRRILN